MNRCLLFAFLTIGIADLCFGGSFPSIASLKAGEKVRVSMRLFGYSITGADFLFTPEKAIITPLNMKPGDMILTKEEKVKLDEYLTMVRKGRRRPPGQEGFEYSIKFFRNEQETGSWSFEIYDARESKKPILSLYELKDRVEKKQKEVEQVEAQNRR